MTKRTEADVEALAIADYTALLGQVIEVTGLVVATGADNDWYDCREPVLLVVCETARDDVCRWMDEGVIDPTYSVGLADPHLDFTPHTGRRPFFVYGRSHGIVGSEADLPFRIIGPATFDQRAYAAMTLNEEPPPIENAILTASHREKVEVEWGRAAGETVEVRVIEGRVYGFCGELGALRLFKRYAPNARADYSKHVGSWYFTFGR